MVCSSYASDFYNDCHGEPLFATRLDGKLGHQVPTVLHTTMAEVEDTTTTAYKSRIIGGHISKQLYKHKLQHVGADRPPLMVGLQGPQGCGKYSEQPSLIFRQDDDV